MSAAALIEAAREFQEWEKTRTFDLWYGNTLVRRPVNPRKPRPLLSELAPKTRPLCACGKPVAKNGIRCSGCHKREVTKQRPEYKAAQREKMRQWHQEHREYANWSRAVRADRAKRSAKPLPDIRTCACGNTFSTSYRAKLCSPCRRKKYGTATRPCRDCGRAIRAVDGQSCGTCYKKRQTAKKRPCFCGRAAYLKGRCRTHYKHLLLEQNPEYAARYRRAERARSRRREAKLRQSEAGREKLRAKWRRKEVRRTQTDAGRATLRAKWHRQDQRRKAKRQRAA